MKMLFTLLSISTIIFNTNVGDAFLLPSNNGLSPTTVYPIGSWNEKGARTTTLSSPWQSSNFLSGRSSKISSSSSSSDEKIDEIETEKRLVWLTGWTDLRTNDHGGFLGALQAAENTDKNTVIIPVFVVDPEMHLRSTSPSCLRRLHASLSFLEKELSSSSSSVSSHPLVVRTGSVATVLPELAKELSVVSCHVVSDDVVGRTRNAQRSACDALAQIGVDVVRWESALRPSAPWAANNENDGSDVLLPSYFPDYCEIADSLEVKLPQSMGAETTSKEKSTKNVMSNEHVIISSDGVPSIEEFLEMGRSATPDHVLKATSRPEASTTEPYDVLVTELWSNEAGAKKALKEYCVVGKDIFANKHMISSDASNTGFSSRSPPSLYASAAARIVKDNQPKDVLALREAPTRAFSSALSLGALSAREVLDAARNKASVTPSVLFFDAPNEKTSNNQAGLLPSDDPLWGRSSEGSLSDVVEWREWSHLLAERSLKLQENGQPATSGGEKEKSNKSDGDPRETGKIDYWRFKSQHLVRYMTWPAGKDYDETSATATPAMLLVHGFAASVEQWERLVYSLRKQHTSADGLDTTPPIFAVDLLGFGHSEKPGLSYTQYLWESQIVDFVMEVMEAKPVVLCGNSIGGGLSCGAAASLGPDLCRGLVLCNTAGVVVDPKEYTAGLTYENNDGTKTKKSHTEAAMDGNPETPYAPVPLFGNKALDVFGKGIVDFIFPQIEDRLSLIYGNNEKNTDAAVVYAIQQSAIGPGSANVVGSGQKLGPNRPLNEVICGGSSNKDSDEASSPFFDGPVLVVMGLDDQVSSPVAAQKRAETFKRLNPGVLDVETIDNAGHCPHDDQPDKVAEAVFRWQSKVLLQTGKKEKAKLEEQVVA